MFLFCYQQLFFIASSLRRITFICISFGNVGSIANLLTVLKELLRDDCVSGRGRGYIQAVQTLRVRRQGLLKISIRGTYRIGRITG